MAVKKPMTKAQIVKYFADKFNFTKKQATEILDEMAFLAAKETKRCGVYTIPGIGKLSKTRRKARWGRNPATGDKIKIAAKTVVKARLSKACQEAIVPPKKK